MSKPDILRKVNLTLLDHDTCNRTFKGGVSLKMKYIHEGQFCTKPGVENTCEGDSGGPLQTVDDLRVSTIIGITSSGFDCDNDFTPAVYTKVSYFLNWIEDIVWPNSELDNSL